MNETPDTAQRPAQPVVATGPLFAVLPGMVTSRNDGQRHYIGADALIRLYKVPPALCKIVTDPSQVGDLHRLEPSYRGIYTLPKHLQAAVNHWLSANTDSATKR